MVDYRFMSPTEVYRLLCDIWDLYREYAQSLMNEGEFELFMDKCKSIQKKYGTVFSVKLFAELLREIERIEKARS